MGIFEKGALGPVSGSVGPVVFCTLNGQDVVKSKPTKSKKAPTLLQLAVRLKFAMSTEFLSLFSDLISIGFKQVNKKTSRMNSAVSKLITENITGVYPDFKIDYANVTLSNGKLEGAQNLVVESKVQRQVSLTWAANDDTDPLVSTVRNNDVVYVVFYDPTSKRVLRVNGNFKRGDGLMNVQITRLFTGPSIHGWLCFVSEDGKLVSPSKYLGTIVPLV